MITDTKEDLERVFISLKESPPTLQEMRETVEGMVWGFYHFNTDEEFYADIKKDIANYSYTKILKLYSLERLLADPTQADFLFDVVLWRAGRPVESKGEALQWLQDFADRLREMLGDKAPPKP
jgi:hypothetical protein